MYNVLVNIDFLKCIFLQDSFCFKFVKIVNCINLNSCYILQFYVINLTIKEGLDIYNFV